MLVLQKKNNFNKKNMKKFFLIIFPLFLTFIIIFFSFLYKEEKVLGVTVGGPCKFIHCYSNGEDMPCPQKSIIEQDQKKIFSLKSYMLYFRNRTLAEKKDLEENIEKIIKPNLKWYDDKIKQQEDILSQVPAESERLREFWQKTIDAYKEQRKWLEEEKEYKEKLIEKLQELADKLYEYDQPVNDLISLTQKCFSNIEEKCSGECKGGCHDYRSCQAKGACSGGNPCPDISEFETKVSNIKNISASVKQICDEIIKIVDEIPVSRTSINF